MRRGSLRLISSSSSVSVVDGSIVGRMHARGRSGEVGLEGFFFAQGRWLADSAVITGRLAGGRGWSQGRFVDDGICR